MYIHKVTHFTGLLALELSSLVEQLEGVNFEAYWRHLIQYAPHNELAVFVAWDKRGLHGFTHADAPSDMIPEEGEICFASTDRHMTREDSRRLLAATESWLREQGATKWGMNTDRNWRAFERLYGPFEHSHRLVKKL